MPRPAKNYAGHTWGNWVVVERAGTIGRSAAWKCRCAKCGHEQIIPSNRIAAGEGVVCAKCDEQPRTPKFCSDADFVRAWQAAATIRDVALQFGATRGWAYFRAHRLRKHGVALKKMSRSLYSEAHYAALRDLAESLGPPKPTE